MKIPSHILKERAITILATTIGSIIFAFGVDLFIIPAALANGGLSGFAVLLYYLTDIPVGIINGLINIPIMYAAYRWLGSWQAIMTAIGTIICSAALDGLHFLSAYQVVHNPIVASIGGGIFTGAGLGIVYRYGGNTGGLDPIAFIIRKYYGIQLGTVNLIMNVIVLALAVYVTSIELALITLINVFLASELINQVVMGFSKRKAVFIISDHTEIICHLILHHLGRGATLLNGEGAYTNTNRQVILTVVSIMQLAKLKQAIEHTDPDAFMFITDTSEVVGQGFSMAIKEPKQKDLPKDTNQSYIS